MKRLTDDEIRFVKNTGFTPTVWQCDEYYKTAFTDEALDYNAPDYSLKKRDEYSDRWYKAAYDCARFSYNFDLDEFIKKNLGDDLGDYDAISLEYVATYLLYCFFSKEELEKMTDKEATKFLQDYRYYFGFRKHDSGNMQFVQEALEVYDGSRVFYEADDGNIENARVDEIENMPSFDRSKILKLA